jgi:hypothetical protein
VHELGSVAVGADQNHILLFSHGLLCFYPSWSLPWFLHDLLSIPYLACLIFDAEEPIAQGKEDNYKEEGRERELRG